MDSSQLTTHCLAIWARYAGAISQEDKDFFDERSKAALTSAESLTEASMMLVTARMLAKGIPGLQARRVAHEFVSSHAKQWLEPMYA